MPPRDSTYHVERARAELDAAYRAERSKVAAVHLRLCAFHMERARAIGQAAAAAESRIELDWIERCAPLHERCLAS